MHNACRPWSETLPTASSEAGYEPRNWQMAAPVATVHAPMATSSSPPLSRGRWGWTSRYYPQRTVSFPREGKHLPQKAEAISLCAGETEL